MPVTIGNAGLLSTKIGLAFIWIDVTFKDPPAPILFDILKRIPTHYPGKKKGILVHQLDPNPHPSAFNDYPETRFSVVSLLLHLAQNASEWFGAEFGDGKTVRSLSGRALTYGTISGTDIHHVQGNLQLDSRMGEWLRHCGFELLERASPTWSSRPEMSAGDRHGYWGKIDTLLYVGTGNETSVRETLANKFFGLQEHFLSYILTQGALIMANHIEDDLKESAANRNLESSFLNTFRKRFEAAEWCFLQVQWNLDHTLLHMDPIRFNVHHEYRQLLGVPAALDRIQSQSELINAYFTRRFERSLQHFVFWGAVVGAVTGLGGINVKNWTSEKDVGLTVEFFGSMAAICIGLLTVLYFRSFIVRHPIRTNQTGLRLDGWLRWRDR